MQSDGRAEVQGDDRQGAEALDSGGSHMAGVASSSLAPRTNFFKGEAMGLVECPYMKRWVMDFGPFAIRLHRWEKSDDDRAFHDHPWWFLTLVLRGSYVDVSPAGRDLLTVGCVRFRSANHRHTVEIQKPGTWTVLITGRPLRRWGFWVDGKLLRRDKYFAVHGHHPCDKGDASVRVRPDGSRI